MYVLNLGTLFFPSEHSCLYPTLTVKNLFSNVDEFTIVVRSGDHSWSLWPIHINLKSVLLIRVTSAAKHESLELFKTFMFSRQIIFIPDNYMRIENV